MHMGIGVMSYLASPLWFALIGIVLNSMEASMQTEGLLKQSQQLAAELQTQQRELQQTNEQLEQKAQQLAEQNVQYIISAKTGWTRYAGSTTGWWGSLSPGSICRPRSTDPPSSPATLAARSRSSADSALTGRSLSGRAAGRAHRFPVNAASGAG